MGRLAVLNLKCTMQSWTRTGEREYTTAAGRKNLNTQAVKNCSSDDDKNDVGAFFIFYYFIRRLAFCRY